MGTIRLEAVGIIVREMGAALAFYRRLGLEAPPQADAEGHVEVALPGGHRLLFDTEEVMRSFDPTWQAPAQRGRIGLAFRCPGPSDVDQMVAELAEAGYRVHLPPFDAFWGQRYASVLDPDGNVVDLFAQR